MRVALCLVITLCLALGSLAKKGSEAEFLATLQLTDANLQDAFDGLDLKSDQKIDIEDLRKHYYIKKVEFAQVKFINFLNTDADKDSISKQELDAFLKRPKTTAAVWECTYIKSESLREHCFADQITNYVYLGLDPDAVKAFFKSLDTDGNGVIKIEEVQKLKTNSFNDQEVTNFLAEIGGADGEITEAEFADYVSHEDILDDFRACRTKQEGCKATYDNKCLQAELIEFTTQKLTEKDVLAIFEDFEDDTDDDLDITVEDIQKVGGCNAEIAKKFVLLMDKSGDGKICYAEFRTYVRTHLVRSRLESDCAAKIVEQAKEVACYKTDLLKRVADFFIPVWFRTPDSDMVFLFEYLDHSNNGKINKNDDLVNGYKWAPELAEKFVKDMDGPDADTDVTLEEFLDYIHWPHMAYGLGDCLGIGRCEERVTCFSTEIKDMFTVMMVKPKVHSFFKFYDKDNNGVITRKDVEAKGLSGESLQNFLDDLGMGDETIVIDEFFWYVQQQVPSHKFVEAACKNHDELHAVLVDYVGNVMTEYDFQELFSALDTDNNFELSVEDFAEVSADIVALIQKMDGSDRDKTVNFLEYWVFLNTPIEKPRKTHLENTCTKPMKTQAEEIECYKKEISKLAKQ